MSESPVIALLGLGEAGSAIASDLIALGQRVQGYDPIAEKNLAGLKRLGSELEAVQDADIILSVNWARVALEVAQKVAAGLRPGQVYAELNTASPAQKRAVAALVEPTGAWFADVALMSTVPGNGVRTPALVCGSGAVRFAECFASYGMPLRVIEGEVGAAAARKLVRSVFYKGLAAAVGEALEAAQRFGFAQETRQDIDQTLTQANARSVDRLIEGSRLHAKRRAEEMAAAAAMLQELGLEPHLAAATRDWLLALDNRS
jgi:3-hydroxyisobutyrate dehydrogenase-like beta-hydroxyacid dehydrogenase